MKLGQLTEYNKGNIFPQNAENESGRLVPVPFYFFFLKCVIWGESKWFATYFQYISIVLNLAHNKSKMYKTLDHWSRDMLNFNFSEKSLGLVSPRHFVHDFSRKMFVTLHSINWPNFNVWLPLLLEILGNMCITIVC